MQENIFSAVSRLICGDDEEKATAFLISPNRAVTATHAITNALEGEDIILEFLNISNTLITKKAKPIAISEDLNNSPITVLELEESIDLDYYLEFSDYELNGSDICNTYGYPVTTWAVGSAFEISVTRRIKDNMTKAYDWDLDLDHHSKIEEFEGLSGSPLIFNNKVVGVILAESKENGKAISLGAISTPNIKGVLDELEISIASDDDDDLFDNMDLLSDLNYDNSIFIAKLESAGIMEHEICQRDFYSAEIVKKKIESKNMKVQLNRFKMLRRDLHSVWWTQYLEHQEEVNGYRLLTKVYTRVEDLSESTLKSDDLISLIAKKGMLHQLADECRIGWIKDYKIKLREYLDIKENKR
ncbi:hypothetical protein MK805_15500 [Shimazuella sp. AN120528]|uniref:ABC-three component system protein n=1 Tax=Shimazuella soli TaxID=1892854 RepID=UPI001F113362|nr:ABC-three component system protein [Shimazuella soli]MCH5586348.1 hypothetical protein [Shimazuella soli]